MKKIYLTQGQYTLVDDEDYDYLNQWKWTAHRTSNKYTYYAVRTSYVNGKRSVRMHRLLAERYLDLVNYEIDHIDRNGLNNQKDNIRIADRSLNCFNRRNFGKYPKGVSVIRYKYKCNDVCIKEYTFYRARITRNKKTYFLGNFKTISEASEAYEKAAKKYYKKDN